MTKFSDGGTLETLVEQCERSNARDWDSMDQTTKAACLIDQYLTNKRLISVSSEIVDDWATIIREAILDQV